MDGAGEPMLPFGPMDRIAQNVRDVKARIAAAAEGVGRDPGEVALVAVSKTVEPARIEAALAAGVRVLGESRVQEAEDKIPMVRGEAEWHLVGKLQRNKARTAAALFEAIHSIGGTDLIERLREGRAGRPPLGIYVQLDVNEGASEEELLKTARQLCGAVLQTPGLELMGLMTLPPYAPDPEASRPHFRGLRRIRDALAEEGAVASSLGLSMGMSGDFEVAVEEGATAVRIGTAIFGPRPG